MTSEIAILNRRAVALAADNATTVQYWERGEKKLRFFRGTSKIFSLSRLHPVAVMTYESGNLHGIPWEVLVKAYCEHLASSSRDFLAGYSTDFLEYVQKNRDLYDDETQMRQLLKAVREQAGFLVGLMDPAQAGPQEKDPRKKTRIMEEGFQKLLGEVVDSRPIGSLTAGDIDHIVQRNKNATMEALQGDPYIMDCAGTLDIGKLADLTVKALFSSAFSTMEKSGLVICGFGQKDYFPAIEQYIFYGIVMGKLLYERSDTRQISQENVAEIMPFAQSDMTKSFMYGAQPLVMAAVDSNLSRSFDKFEALLRAQNHLVEADLGAIKTQARAEVFADLAAALKQSYADPMKRVVGALPVDELADLAETLVRLESLEERFTRDSDAAGSPIDVAVITKGDGFIWVKRQQYFDPELNPMPAGGRARARHV